MADLGRQSLDRSQIATTVSLNGKTVDAILDTGAPTSWVSRATAERVGAIEVHRASAQSQSRARSHGRSVSTSVGLFASFSIGDDETVSNVELRIADLFSRDTEAKTGSHIPKPVEGLPDMLIGCDFFLAHRILVAFKEGKLLMTYNGGKIFQVIALDGRSTDAPAPMGEVTAPMPDDRP
jgi:hypothetical protein